MALAAVDTSYTELIMPAGIRTAQDALIEVATLGDALETQISRAEQIIDLYRHELNNAQTAEQRAVLMGKIDEAQDASGALEADLQRVDEALEQLEIN